MGSPQVEVLSFDGFVRAEEAWTELLRETDAPAAFLLHPWISCWWRHFGAGQEFQALVLRDGPSFVAAVPLALRRAGVLGFGLTLAEFAGTGAVAGRDTLADKVDLLVRRDAEPSRERLVRELLARLDRIDVLDLRPYDAGSATCACLERLAGPQATTLPRSVSPFLTLPASWEEYLTQRSPKFRKNRRRALRSLEALGEVTLTRLPPGGDCAAWLEEVLDVDRESWTAARGTNLFGHPTLRAFFLDLLPRLHARGWLDLHVLRVAGRALAYEICLEFGGTLYAYNAGYRLAHADSSPGNLVSSAVVESACGRGLATYDMLRGSEAYKERWASGSRRELQTIVAARRWAARLYAQLGIRARNRVARSGLVARLKDRIHGLTARSRG
jgi:CelD/BcsL family acetyltransferase involved in cellulose biosynthesis